MVAACGVSTNEELKQASISSLCFKAGVKVPGALKRVAKEVKREFTSCSSSILFI